MRSRWSAERRLRRNCFGGGERNDLLLHARLVASLHVVQPLLIARFIRRVYAALNPAGKRLDAILERRTEERISAKLKVLIWLSFQFEHETERLLDVVQREAETGRDPELHERLGRVDRRSAETENLKRNSKRERDALLGNLHHVGDHRILRRNVPRRNFQAVREHWRLALVYSTRAIVPPILKRLNLILVERKIGLKNRRRARLVQIELELLLRDRVADADVLNRGHQRTLSDERTRVSSIVVKPDVQNVARRNEKAISLIDLTFNDVVPTELIEDVSGLGDDRKRAHRLHQVKLGYLVARIAERERVRVPVDVERARRVEEKVRDRLVRVRPLQDSRERGVCDAIAPTLAIQAPVSTGTHRDRLSVGGNAGFDDRRVRQSADRIVPLLPPVERRAVRQIAAGDRKSIRTRTEVPLDRFQNGLNGSNHERPHPRISLEGKNRSPADKRAGLRSPPANYSERLGGGVAGRAAVA